MRKLTILQFMLASMTASAFAVTIHVPDNQPTIQAGLNSAVEGDTVLVASGTYYENITWPAVNGIKLIGSGQEDCIIDGDSQASVIRFEEDLDGIVDATTLVKDLTIQNGYAHGESQNIYGGGLYCYESSPCLEWLDIADNSAQYGGGVYCDQLSNPILTNTRVGDNSADDGGGLYLSESNPNFFSVLITDNSADASGGGGGGICCYDASPNMSHVSLVGNTAFYGGAITCGVGSEPSLTNCLLWSNHPQELFFIPFDVPNLLTISCSDIEGGEAGIETNDNGTVYWLENNIDADPLFCDPENGDYRLQLDSPCRTDVCGFMGYTGETCEGESIEDRITELTGFYLANAYPNPFNPFTTIEYNLTFSSEVLLSVYNISGQLVDVVQAGFVSAGHHNTIWTPSDLPSGVYLVELQASGVRDVMKISYVK